MGECTDMQKCHPENLIKYVSIWRSKPNLNTCGWEVFSQLLVDKHGPNGKEYIAQAKQLLSNASEMRSGQSILLSSDTEQELIHVLPHMMESGRCESMVVFIVVTCFNFNHIYSSEELLCDFRERFLTFNKICREEIEKQSLQERINILQVLLDKYGHRPQQDKNEETICTLDCNRTTAVINNNTQYEQYEEEIKCQSTIAVVEEMKCQSIAERFLREVVVKEPSFDEFYLNKEELKEDQLAQFQQQQWKQHPQKHHHQKQREQRPQQISERNQ